MFRPYFRSGGRGLVAFLRRSRPPRRSSVPLQVPELRRLNGGEDSIEVRAGVTLVVPPLSAGQKVAAGLDDVVIVDGRNAAALVSAADGAAPASATRVMKEAVTR